MQTHRNRAYSASASTAGMLSSLSHSLPNPNGPLARSARALAGRLSDGAGNREDHDAAAALLARLLDETDVGLAYDEDGLLDEGFDA